MIVYTMSRLAQREHDQMVESLRPVPEHGATIVARQPSWTSRQASRLLIGLGSLIKAFRAHLGDKPRTVPEAPIQGQLERQPSVE